MANHLIKQLIDRYQNVYLFAMKNISNIVSDQGLDLTLEQFAVLKQLHKYGDLRPSELADCCGVNKSAMTAKIDRLYARGLVERIRDDNDRRSVYIKITEAGELIYLKGEERIESFVGSYLEELTQDEFETFLSLYEKITAIIDKKVKGEQTK
ncbi:MarR family winged helix-turn-helix transcriptional regulator [Bacillus sp. 03113]|uniref:MarR family winged helix-turn-helix transcriptional regulator n=1 Tax=Bacillus sp. 03113 TaxID=2578211 RepID=UPI00114381AF|nr:MarR family transcriptional regulator [Bacillus sp. 03113]